MEPFHKPLVIYHGGCRDGFCASWVAHRFFSQPMVRSDEPVEYFAGYYGQPPPDVAGRDVYILDFSYKRIVMERLLAEARSLVVLDHHATAEEDLKGLAPSVHFDMERSGAGMAWDHFMRGEPRSWLVNYVEDRDLWRKALHASDAVTAYIGVMPFNFDEWDREHNIGLRESVIQCGYTVLSKIEQYCTEVLKNAQLVECDGYIVPIVNAPQVDISELLSKLARMTYVVEAIRDIHDLRGKLPPFVMGWWQRHDGRFQYSLRSVGDFDVSVIAKAHGGGGHKNAAGFEAQTPVHLGR